MEKQLHPKHKTIFSDKNSLNQKINKKILIPLQKELNGSTLILHLNKILQDMPKFILKPDILLIEQAIQNKLEKNYTPDTRLIVFLKDSCLTPYINYLNSLGSSLPEKYKIHIEKPILFSAHFREKLRCQKTFSKIIFVLYDEEYNCFDYKDILNETVPLPTTTPCEFCKAPFG